MKTIYEASDLSKNGKHDFEKPTAYSSYENMSAGIFQWELKSNGKSLKRKKVIVRVIGTKYQGQEIELKATEVCNLLDKNKWSGKKSIRI